MNYTTFLMKLGKLGDDEIIVCSIKGKKGPKKISKYAQAIF